MYIVFIYLACAYYIYINMYITYSICIYIVYASIYMNTCIYYIYYIDA